MKIDDISAADIDYSKRTPCADCPFRKDAPFHEGILQAYIKIHDAIDDGNFQHSCHKTDPRSDGFVKGYEGKPQHCAGALIYQRNLGVLRKNRSLIPAIIYSNFKASLIRKSPKIFGSKLEMLKHYVRGYNKAHPGKELPIL